MVIQSTTVLTSRPTTWATFQHEVIKDVPGMMKEESDYILKEMVGGLASTYWQDVGDFGGCLRMGTEIKMAKQNFMDLDSFSQNTV